MFEIDYFGSNDVHVTEKRSNYKKALQCFHEMREACENRFDYVALYDDRANPIIEYSNGMIEMHTGIEY